jgi:hypothetical protein
LHIAAQVVMNGDVALLVEAFGRGLALRALGRRHHPRALTGESVDRSPAVARRAASAVAPAGIATASRSPAAMRASGPWKRDMR